MNILSVVHLEDKKDEQKLFAEYAASQNIKIYSTDSSSIAEKYTLEYSPDAVIVDLELKEGEGSGISYLKEFSKIYHRKRPYVIITTIISSLFTESYARELGADFIFSKLQKDYSPKLIFDLIKTCCELNSNQNLPKHYSYYPYIKEEIDKLFMKKKLKGYKYLIEATDLKINNKDNYIKIIAEKYMKSINSIELAMKNAINNTWKNTDIETLFDNYTDIYDGEAPTVSEFINYYANKIYNKITKY